LSNRLFVDLVTTGSSMPATHTMLINASHLLKYLISADSLHTDIVPAGRGSVVENADARAADYACPQNVASRRLRGENSGMFRTEQRHYVDIRQ
jgi:hypothetical protein